MARNVLLKSVSQNTDIFPQTSATQVVWSNGSRLEVNGNPNLGLTKIELTLSADTWEGSGPYYYNVIFGNYPDLSSFISGQPILVSSSTIDVDANKALQEDLRKISQIVTTADFMTFICYDEKPEHTLNVVVPRVI